MQIMIDSCYPSQQCHPHVLLP